MGTDAETELLLAAGTIEARFHSGNPTPLDCVRVQRDEWERLKAGMVAVASMDGFISHRAVLAVATRLRSLASAARPASRSAYIRAAEAIEGAISAAHQPAEASPAVELAPASGGLTWFFAAERLPERSGDRVLAHVATAAGSEYATLAGEPEGWQALDMATFWRRTDGTHEWQHETAGDVVRWAYVDTTSLIQGGEPWV
ncbi:TPA: hypothetical protein QDZ75_003911 [Stenotrophomonas maltophilia]|nr:hypothetical protein [Stenotrophomonas maltophilia]